MVIFDAPAMELQQCTFEHRYQNIIVESPSSHPVTVSWIDYIKAPYFIDRIKVIAPRVKCVSEKQLIAYSKEILEHGGEGVILRKPKSTYEHGRSSSLIKYKVCPFQ